jgi:hypothetical protein
VYESKLFDSCSQEVQMWAINNAIRATESDYNIGTPLLISLPGDFHAKTYGRWGSEAVSRTARRLQTPFYYSINHSFILFVDKRIC